MSPLIQINLLLINSYSNYKEIVDGGIGDIDGPDNSTGTIILNPENDTLELVLSIILAVTGLIAIPFLFIIILFSINNRNQRKQIKELDKKIMNKEI